MKFLKVVFILSILFSIGCVKDDMNIDDNNEDEKITQVIILNQGAFSKNNASISIYNPTTQEVRNEVFFGINNFPLGDIGQSMTLVNDSLLWVVVNNSGKIEIINANTLKSVNTITGLTSPRYVVTYPIKNKAYVSNLYVSNISVINMETQKISRSISLSNPVEEMVKYSDHYIIAAGWVGNNQLYKIDINSGLVVDSVEVRYEPGSIEFDSEGNLWVLCSGGYPYPDTTYRKVPGLLKVDPETMEVIDIYEFTEDAYPSDLEYDHIENSLYFIMGTVKADKELGVFKVDISSGEVPSSALIPNTSERTFYQLSIDEEGNIWATDAGDFASPGTVYKYDADGNEITSFQAGVAPSQVMVYKK